MGSAGCPEAYRDDEDLWRATVRTTISDSVDGHAARLSLGPIAACGRNLGLLPHRPRLHALRRTLRAFGDDGSSSDVDHAVLTALGAPTPERRWLAASLQKTIRLQLDPPSDVRQEMAVLGLVPTSAG